MKMDVRKDHARLLDNLQTLQKHYTAKALASSIGISPTSWSRKMKEPWKHFCYDEFYLIARYCKIDMDVLINGTISVK